MKKININTNWNFLKLPDSNIMNPIAPDTGFTPVSLPHTWYTDEDQYRGLTIYKKTVKTEKDWKKVFIEFCGADQTCKVYVNGMFAGEHKGAYATFRVEVPKKALESEELQIEVFLDNTPNQTICPTFGDFTVFGGLYRDVNLLVVQNDHFDYMYYGTDGIIVKSVLQGQTGTLVIEPHVVSDASDTIITYTVMDEAGNIVSTCQGKTTEQTEITIEGPNVWNGLGDTHLYKVTASLIVKGQSVDEVTKETGFRAFALDASKGFHLNGKHVKINGVSKHQDVANKFSAITIEEINKDFALISEIGANAVRLSHYQHVQNTYDLCDHEGYIVWAEIPMLKMTEDEELLENTRCQLTELVLQNIHHPSIFFWGIQNEIGMFKDVEFMHDECKKLREVVKQLDDTRLVTAANLYSVKFESELNRITDMIGYNIYFGWYYGEMKDYDTYLDELHAVIDDMPLGVSEYGVDASPFLHADEPKVKDYSEEYQSLFHETVYPIFQKKDYLWGSFIWNMFDFSSARRNEGGVKYINQKGLVTFDREIKKDAFYYYKSQWSREPFIHICSKRFEKRASEQINVKIYTNLDEVKIVSKQYTATKKNDGNGTVEFCDIPLLEGNNEFTVISTVEKYADLQDSVVFEKVETPVESYALPDSGAGTTVKNWFLEDDTLVREGYYSLEDSAYDITQSKEALEVLREFTPDTVDVLLGDVGIPMGFQLLRILNYNKEVAEKVNMKELNNRLNQVKKKN